MQKRPELLSDVMPFNCCECGPPVAMIADQASAGHNPYLHLPGQVTDHDCHGLASAAPGLSAASLHSDSLLCRMRRHSAAHAVAVTMMNGPPPAVKSSAYRPSSCRVTLSPPIASWPMVTATVCPPTSVQVLAARPRAVHPWPDRRKRARGHGATGRGRSRGRLTGPAPTGGAVFLGLAFVGPGATGQGTQVPADARPRAPAHHGRIGVG